MTPHSGWAPNVSAITGTRHAKTAGVKEFNWNDEKNASLKRERGVSFEEIVFHIEHGGLLETVEHPNQEKFSGQRLFVVRIGNYVYIVPFVESEKEYFLKTIVASRKATRKYIGKVTDNA